ncbi:MAG: hypothetical protein K2O58_00085 [Bacteroidales bacterium]|nr:hypothetical protein [Bacteroidales bacterium]
MEILFAAILLVGLCVIGLCFNIIFRKDGRFPDTEISHNKEMRMRGIVCAKEDELRIWGRKNGKDNPTCSDLGCGDCRGCEILTEKSSREGNG